MSKKLDKSDLNQFTGTFHWYRHQLIRNVVYTDGVKFLAERAQCHWLVDAIASHIGVSPELHKAMEADTRLQEMQFWTLTAHDDGSFTLTCTADGDVPPAITQDHEYTDFTNYVAFNEVSIWAEFDGEKWVLLLPSEH